MTTGQRIRQVRKTLNLTTENFGKRIGVARSTISNIETNKRVATEHMLRSICLEYNINYTWLTNGEGEMFTDGAFFARIDKIMANEGNTRSCLFKALLDASDEDIEAIKKIIDMFAKYTD